MSLHNTIMREWKLTFVAFGPANSYVDKKTTITFELRVKRSYQYCRLLQCPIFCAYDKKDKHVIRNEVLSCLSKPTVPTKKTHHLWEISIIINIWELQVCFVTDCVSTSWKVTLNFKILWHWMLIFLTPRRIQRTAYNNTLIITWKAKYTAHCKPMKQGIANWMEQCYTDEHSKTWRCKTVQQIPKPLPNKP
jgi:hypothetical protein